MVEKRLYEGDVYSLCVRERFFESGDCLQYETMFRMVRDGKPIRDIAMVIWICSINKGFDFDYIYNKLDSIAYIPTKD